MAARWLTAITVLAAVAVAGAAEVPEFSVELTLKNAHLGALEFGCAAGATDDWDRNRDDLAPPPGMAVGYVGFVSPGNPFHLSKDYRAPADSVTWEMVVQPYRGKDVVLQWKQQSIPDGLPLVIQIDGQRVNMHETDSLRVSRNAKLVFAGGEAGDDETDKPEQAAGGAPAPQPPEPIKE